MSLWDRLKDRVDTASTSLSSLSLHRGEKDKGEDNTVISRALLRYYGTQVPDWLTPSVSEPVLSSRTHNSIERNKETKRPSLDFLYRAESSPATGTKQRLERRETLGSKLRHNW